MAIYKRLFVFWIFMYTCLSTEGADYHISTDMNTWNNIPKGCQLAQPEYDHEPYTGQTTLRNFFLDGTLEHDVWIGYYNALTEFKYHGCAVLWTSDGLNVKSLVDCKYACNGNYFGLYVSWDTLKCKCLDQLPPDLKRTSCVPCGDFVCGRLTTAYGRLAIYSLGSDKTSRNQSIISNLCKASPSNVLNASWIKCDDKDNKRKVWCRKDASSKPLLYEQTFAAWNSANDYCADRTSLPSTAVGYTGRPINDMAFTNIFRIWTLQKENGSISSGPMMYAYVSANSMEIKFTANTTESKNYLCLGPKPTSPPSTISTTQGKTSGTTYTTQSISLTTTPTSTVNPVKSPTTTHSTSTTQGQTSGTTTTTSAVSKQQASKGSSTTAVAAGVSVTVAIAVSAVVIIIVLRNRKKLCFANKKRSDLDNRDDDNHISLQNDLHQAPGAPVINKTYVGQDIGNIKSKTDEHDYFVLEKQQPNVGNRNVVSTNEVHPYFLVEKEGDQPVHDRPPNEAHPYFVLEKHNTGNPPPLHTANALDLENTDGDTYQEIDTDDTYAGIDDSREDNNDYDYTNKAFKDSRTEISDNVYNHLNSAGDEYDRLGKGQSNDEAMENNYDVTSSVV